MCFRSILTCVLVAASMALARATFGKEHVHIKIHLATPEHHVNEMSGHHDQHGGGGSGGGDEHIEITSPGGIGNGDHDFSGDFNHGGPGTLSGYGNGGSSGGSYGNGGYGVGTGLTAGHGSIGYRDEGSHTSHGYGGGHSKTFSGSFGSINGVTRPDFGSAGFSGGYVESGRSHGKEGHPSITFDEGIHGSYAGESSGNIVGGGHQTSYHDGGFNSGRTGSVENSGYSGGGVDYSAGSLATDHNDHSVGGYGNQLSSGLRTSDQNGYSHGFGGNHGDSSGGSKNDATSGRGHSGNHGSNSYGGQTGGDGSYSNGLQHSPYSGSHSTGQDSVSFRGPDSYTVEGSGTSYYGSGVGK